MPRLLLLLLVLVAPVLLAADLAPKRAQFQAAWRLAQAGVDTSTRVSGLEDYPLYPYLPYERLRRLGAKAPDKEIVQFLRDYGDSRPGQRLRAQTLERYGRSGQYPAFLKIYVESLASVDLRCHAWSARRAGKVKGDATAEALALFDALDKDRADCRPVLAHLRGSGQLTPARVNGRIDTALAAGQTGLAQVLSHELPKAQQAPVQRRILAHTEPSVALNQAARWPATAASAAAASVALAQMARKGALAAESRYESLATRLPLKSEERARIEGYRSAVEADRKLSNEALDFTEH